MNVKVLLSGSLKTNGYVNGQPANHDGTYRLEVADGSTVAEVIRGMNIPLAAVALTMVNSRQCALTTPVSEGDRIALIPSDVAPFWRYVELMNLKMVSLVDF